MSTTVKVSVIGGTSVDVPWYPNMNAQQALEGAYNQLNNSSKFTYALQYYGGQLGYFVVMINETYDSFGSSSEPYFYWEFFVNGKSQTVGIDNVTLNSGDDVAFNFLPYNSEEHINSTLSVKHAFQTRHAGSGNKDHHHCK